MDKFKRINFDSQIVGWVVVYSSLAVTLAWIVLKLTGVIHSPPWQEYIPFVALIISIFAVSVTVAKPLGLISPIYDRLLRLEDKVNDIDKHNNILELDNKYFRKELSKIYKEHTEHMHKFHS